MSRSDDAVGPWCAGARPSAPGGFVGSVGLNEPVMPELAIHPGQPSSRAVPTEPSLRRRRAPMGEGARVTVRRMGDVADDRVRANGRVHLPKG